MFCISTLYATTMWSRQSEACCCCRNNWIYYELPVIMHAAIVFIALQNRETPGWHSRGLLKSFLNTSEVYSPCSFYNTYWQCFFNLLLVLYVSLEHTLVWRDWLNTDQYLPWKIWVFFKDWIDFTEEDFKALSGCLVLHHSLFILFTHMSDSAAIQVFILTDSFFQRSY